MEARARSNELTLLAIMSTVVMLFAAFTSAYLIRRTGADWRQLSLPGIFWFNTAIVIVSSLTLEITRHSGSRRWLVATCGLGLAFLVGQLLGWNALAAEGILLPSNPHSSFIYMLTAVHGAHLAGGIVALLIATARKGPFGLCAAYWHFVGAVWLYLIIMLSVL